MFSGSNKQFSKVFRYSVWPECMTRPRYYYFFSTTTKSTKQFFFFAEFAFRECLVRNTEMNTFVLGHQHGQIVLPWRDKTLPRIQKHVPESKNTFQTPLDSGKCFWILGSVLDLDSGKTSSIGILLKINYIHNDTFSPASFSTTQFSGAGRGAV